MAVINNLMNMGDQMKSRYQSMSPIMQKSFQESANKYFGGGRDDDDDEQQAGAMGGGPLAKAKIALAEAKKDLAGDALRKMTAPTYATATPNQETQNKEEFNPIPSISKAVEGLAFVNDEANSWMYRDEKEKDEAREELRREASQAYEAATPEQRAQNKDLIANAAKLLNPPATPSSVVASDPAGQPDSQPSQPDSQPSSPAPTDGGDSRSQAEKERDAARKVALARMSGSGLDAYEAMQDPNYKVGSASKFEQRRRLGTESGAMRREARRLQRMGLTGAANQMALAASQQKLREGSGIRTQEDIAKQMQDQFRMEDQIGQIEGLNQRMIDFQNRLLDRRMKELDEEDEEDKAPSILE